MSEGEKGDTHQRAGISYTSFTSVRVVVAGCEACRLPAAQTAELHSVMDLPHDGI